MLRVQYYDTQKIRNGISGYSCSRPMTQGHVKVYSTPVTAHEEKRVQS